MKFKTGDPIRILTGKDKGKEGKIIQVFPKLDRVVVEGLNLRKRHLRASAGRTGQIVEFPAPIHVSNVAIVGAGGIKTGRVGYKFIDEEGKKKKIRVIRRAGKTEDID
ncbi:TPA: 50S ribosomal protein L24 [Candidatus Uhrbacteria bacterium]|uniref:Large ribosomal subunit protein uL24 n=1 Tax=Candidatus Uhrbacteria bacterium GW2011_GWC2_53_7 TaxID=1618986 RepID=A0A0G1Y1V9_9BACT|nr:MAG: Ribosomal protein L24 [Parcubacteria group bacterium GW2011_GWA2_53_21]KKW37110.1 MAG: Ribosomal protein L24 [Candidatus Uhrbacteria bacterium GW2011_GWC2_53_7]OGL72197.1 MAG: 50S ribosomal protein L24 [Candidatus Uhrbacteria bacterium RIFCSPHIGHO2_02_FULL_54_11]HBL39431.1 50S ribosomal protein L24 [Candidatus Uhrbacteria bacterium]